MKDEIQKTLNINDSHPEVKTESREKDVVYTYIGIIDDNLVEVRLGKDDLLERILCPDNLQGAYKQVVGNKGAGGVDEMETSELLPYLNLHLDELIETIMSGKYQPMPVRRVEIPKDNGKKRQLGIPTVVDRFIQQSISQILSGIYEPLFNDNSFGFRPNRSTLDAIKRVQQYANEGYYYCVDLDLERFFDTVNHSKLIQVISENIKDGRVVSLIHKYLNAGVMVNHKFEETIEGVPQGGPLSPILSNIILNELDSELSRRGHRFVRYADDCMILVKSLRAAERVKESIATFVEKKLFLRVNKEKTVVGPLVGKKFLGYSFYFSKDGKIGLTVHKKSKDKFHRELKTITNRSNGKGYLWLKERLAEYVRGWFDYYYLADMKSFLNKTEKWYRRRIRSYIWKCWKGVRTRFVNLIKCGISREQAWQWANTRKGYWRIADSWILHTAITNERLVLQGYPSLLGIYTKLHRN